MESGADHAGPVDFQCRHLYLGACGTRQGEANSEGRPHSSHLRRPLRPLTHLPSCTSFSVHAYLHTSGPRLPVPLLPPMACAMLVGGVCAGVQMYFTYHLLSDWGEGCPPPFPCALCVLLQPGTCPARLHTTVCWTPGRPLLAAHPRCLGTGRRPPSPGPRLRPPSMACAMGGDVTRGPFLYPLG